MKTNCDYCSQLDVKLKKKTETMMEMIVLKSAKTNVYRKQGTAGPRILGFPSKNFYILQIFNYLLLATAVKTTVQTLGILI